MSQLQLELRPAPSVSAAPVRAGEDSPARSVAGWEPLVPASSAVTLRLLAAVLLVAPPLGGGGLGEPTAGCGGPSPGGGPAWGGRDIFRPLPRKTPPPLYFVLLKLWMAVFGASPVALRSLSVALGLVTVVGMYLLA